MHYALKRAAYEQAQDKADLPEYSKKEGFGDKGDIPKIVGNYVNF